LRKRGENETKEALAGDSHPACPVLDGERARRDGTLEEYWVQFTEIAAPFRPLIEQLTPEKKAAAVAEILAALRKFWNGKELTLPLEIVIGAGTRP
jgi:hypothetical protein